MRYVYNQHCLVLPLLFYSEHTTACCIFSCSTYSIHTCMCAILHSCERHGAKYGHFCDVDGLVEKLHKHSSVCF